MRLILETPVVYESVTRPVTMGVIKELARVLRLPGNVSVVFAGQTEQTAQPGTNIDGSKENTTFGHDARIKVEVQERPIEDRVLTMAVHQNENRPIFADRALGVFVRPIYSMSEVQISFTLRFPDRVSAQKFRDDALLRAAMLRNETPLVMSYHYSFPYQFLHLLHDIYTLRENQGGYGDTFSQYVSQHIDGRSTEITTLVGGYKTLALPETQIHNWGTFSEFVPSVEAGEKDKASGTWALNFNYRFQYDKPIACIAVWPLVIHNQLIGEPWRYPAPEPNGTITNPWTLKRFGSFSRDAMDYLTKLNDPTCEAQYRPAIIPTIDDWTPLYIRPDTTTMAQVLIGANAEDLNDVLDLSDLEEYEIDADVLEFMKQEAPYMTKYGESIFHLAFYEDDVPQDDKTLSVSEYLRVRTSNPMDLRKLYHLRISVMTDLFFIRSDGVQRLCKNGVAALKILMDLQFRLGSKAYKPKLLNDRYLSMDDYRKIAYRLNEYKRHYSNGREDVLLTVGNYHIVTQRMSSYASSNSEESAGGTNTGAGTDSGQIVSRCDG